MFLWCHCQSQLAVWCLLLDSLFFFFFNFFFYIYLPLRDEVRQRVSGVGAEREGDTESKAGSRLRAVGTEPDVGLEPTNCEIMT